MSDEIRVREADPDDVEAVVDVARDSWYAAYGGFLDPATIEQALGENYAPELVEAGVDHEEVAFFVAEVDGEGGSEVVGFASAERTWADEVELHTIYVHPDRWGDGAGSALFERVESWARDCDVDRIACGVFSENAVGVGFFESLGFTEGAAAEVEIGVETHTEVEFVYEL